MHLSLVIPAYNEAGRIGGTVTHVCEYLDRQPYDWEVIVVIDGGPKAAADEARAAAGARSNVRVIENDVNRGKGYSVRRGFSEARGDRLVFIDADLSLPIEGLDGMMARFDAGADVVIASRTAPGSRVEGAPPAGRESDEQDLQSRRAGHRGSRHCGHAVRIQGLHRAGGKGDFQRRRMRSIWF